MMPKLLPIYGPFAIQSYGAMIVLSLLVFLLVTYNHPRRVAIMSGSDYLNTVFMAFLSGIIGGRMLYVISFWRDFIHRPIEVFFPWTGGFIVLGAILGIVIFMPLYLWWHKLPLLKSFDFGATFGPLMQAIARIGCLLAGCCYGCPTLGDRWFSVTFTNPDGYLPSSLLGVPLHNAQLYAGGASLLIFLFMFFIGQRLLRRPGQQMFAYLILENCARMLVDCWRGDRGELVSVFTFQLSIFQVYSLLFLGVCIIGFCVASLYRTGKVGAR